MADNTPWKWNYFTLESLSKVKCSLCNSEHKPILYISKLLKVHLWKKIKDTKHHEAFWDVSENFRTNPSFTWDSHYKITSSNKILKPNIKCNYCKDYIRMPNKPILEAPQNLGKHLRDVHNIEYRNWEALETWICEKARSYYIVPPKNRVIKVDTCRKCHVKIGAENAIMFVKHLIDKHSEQIQDFPSNIIPRELLLDYDSDDSFDDINTGDLQRENIMEIETLISSNQSMANVLEDSSQIDMQVPSTQLPDPRDIPSTSSGEREDTQNKRRIIDPEIIKMEKKGLKYMKKAVKMLINVDKRMLENDRLLLDYDSDDSFDDINTGDLQRENIMEIETLISSNQPMANVLDDGSQIDVQVPSTQLPDPRDIPSTSSGKRRDIQIPTNKRKFDPKIIKTKKAPKEKKIKMLKMLKDDRNSSSTDDSN